MLGEKRSREPGGPDGRQHKHQMYKRKTADLSDYYVKEVYSFKIQLTGNRLLETALVRELLILDLPV